MTNGNGHDAVGRLRILTVAESFFLEHRNGLARVAWDVCRGMARRGHEVTLVTPSATVSGTSVIEGVRVVRFPQPAVSSFSPWNPRRRIHAYAHALKSMNMTAWDCVHAHGIYSAIAASRTVHSRKRLVVSVHSPAVDEQRWNWSHGPVWDRVKLAALPMIRRAEAASLAAADVCHSLSQWTHRRIQYLYPMVASKPWVMIGHWSNPEWRRTMTPREAREQLGWPVDERVILCVRQLRSRYGLDTAVRSMKEIPPTCRARLRLVGEGELRRPLERLAAGLGLADRVSFSGGVSDADLRLHYQAADVAIVPSHALECFGLISIEALGYGVPVVATNVGALPEILSPILPGLLVPPRNPTALGRCVHTLLTQSGATCSPEAMLNYVRAGFAEERILASYEVMFATGGASPDWSENRDPVNE